MHQLVYKKDKLPDLKFSLITDFKRFMILSTWCWPDLRIGHLLSFCCSAIWLSNGKILCFKDTTDFVSLPMSINLLPLYKKNVWGRYLKIKIMLFNFYQYKSWHSFWKYFSIYQRTIKKAVFLSGVLYFTR